MRTQQQAPVGEFSRGNTANCIPGEEEDDAGEQEQRDEQRVVEPPGSDQQEHSEEQGWQPEGDQLGLEQGGQVSQGQREPGEHAEAALQDQQTGAGEEAADHRVGHEAHQPAPLQTPEHQESRPGQQRGKDDDSHQGGESLFWDRGRKIDRGGDQGQDHDGALLGEGDHAPGGAGQADDDVHHQTAEEQQTDARGEVSGQRTGE